MEITADMENINNTVNDEFYEIYNKKITIIVKRMLSQTGMTQDIDDCINIAYVKLIEIINGYDENRGSMDTYVNLVVHSTVTDYIKSHAKFKNELVGNEILDFFYAPLQCEDEAGFNILVEQILSKLKKEERVLFTMRYLWFYPPEEIAKIMNIKRNTVDVRCKRLKEKIKKYLKGAGI
jgi:RNA polymerase sigma factor (sigma-70 family)